ncbi:hypothetical protein Prudu_022882 [Prunus dulcis]|uniref:Uncharacterized protein n=1 Tax=Prunus dulcis TaxID=3755 RepID=A0A4Y1S0E6_PRUDU|nr:hypothetical protein Prudu_022882 [Prunus dulcis]
MITSLMSNLKIEKKTDDPSGRQQEEEEEEEEQDSSECAESLLGFLHEPTVDFVNKACDTEEERHRAMKSICRLVASLESEAARDLEEFEASIPENPQEWTQEMREYMYEKEKEELVLEKKKRIQKRLDKTYRRRRKIVKKTSKERERAQVIAYLALGVGLSIE